jgi:hypothetical protein
MWIKMTQYIINCNIYDRICIYIVYIFIIYKVNQFIDFVLELFSTKNPPLTAFNQPPKNPKRKGAQWVLEGI